MTDFRADLARLAVLGCDVYIATYTYLDNWQCHIKLDKDGESVEVKKSGPTFETAVHAAIAAFERVTERGLPPAYLTPPIEQPALKAPSKPDLSDDMPF